METLLKALAQHWHLTAAQYWHLRLLVAISLVPFLGFLYVILFDKRTRFMQQLQYRGFKRRYPTRLFSSN
jgi:cytochrome b561